VKTASKMTYCVSGGTLNSIHCQLPTCVSSVCVWSYLVNKIFLKLRTDFDDIFGEIWHVPGTTHLDFGDTMDSFVDPGSLTGKLDILQCI